MADESSMAQDREPRPITADVLAERILAQRSTAARALSFLRWVALGALAWWVGAQVSGLVAGGPRPVEIILAGLSFLLAWAAHRQRAFRDDAVAALTMADVGADRIGVLIELLRWPVRRVRDVARWRLTAMLHEIAERGSVALHPVELACLYEHLTPRAVGRYPELAEAILKALPRIADERAVLAVQELAKSGSNGYPLRRIRDLARVCLPQVERLVLNLRERASPPSDCRSCTESGAASARRAFGEELGQRPQMRLGFLLALWLSVVPAAAWKASLEAGQRRWLEALVWAAIVLAATQAYRFALLARHSRLVRGIMRQEGPEAVGKLAEVAMWPDPKLRAAAMSALTRLLPTLKASDAGVFTSNQRECLNALLHRQLARERPELVVALLRALEQVGDTSAIPHVRALAEIAGSAASVSAIREAAAECLPVLLERARENTDPQVLLRPAEAPGAPGEVLVRPADGGPCADASLLVRPVQQEQQASSSS